ncbi:HPP family protein [Occallatibacter riparius]|uniref:HPP family protein n=1 Tax=Occallatibacter riparius TaxID=1002689 RepID=A0A9J7BU93_9BACT|nr:HPP family protein [Occallatibacter riparius]UWZ86231.1 HPP family protein [Occallatibacter riparius]
MEGKDLVIAPVCEAALLALVGFAGWLTHQPMLFTSLGPTAYELVETPHRPTARPYSILVGHLIAVIGGYIALWVTGAWHVAPVSTAELLPARIGAAAIAAMLTVFGTLFLKASQPAALSTTLLIALGTMQRPRDAAVIMAAVALMNLLGEPIRAVRLRTQTERQEPT